MVETTMKPIQSNTVLANVLDWVNFLIPGIEKCGIGLPYTPNINSYPALDMQ
jgi:hypothetical protein